MQSLINIEHVLHEAGGDLSHVAMLRIYIKEGFNSHKEQADIARALKENFQICHLHLLGLLFQGFPCQNG